MWLHKKGQNTKWY